MFSRDSTLLQFLFPAYSDWTKKDLGGILNAMLRFCFIACLFAPLSCSVAWSKAFDFHDPKGFNSIEFSLVGAFGNGLLLGKISEVKGILDYNPAAPNKTMGTIEAFSRSAQASAPEADAFLRGPSLFDVKRFPLITFAIEKIANQHRIGKSVNLDVQGTLTIKGLARKVRVPAQIDYRPGKLKAHRGVEGDLLVVRCEFVIRRSNFDLGTGKFLKKAADEVKVELTLVGAAPQKAVVPVNQKAPLGLLPRPSRSAHDTRPRRQHPLRQSPKSLR